MWRATHHAESAPRALRAWPWRPALRGQASEAASLVKPGCRAAGDSRELAVKPSKLVSGCTNQSWTLLAPCASLVRQLWPLTAALLKAARDFALMMAGLWLKQHVSEALARAAGALAAWSAWSLPGKSAKSAGCWEAARPVWSQFCSSRQTCSQPRFAPFRHVSECAAPQVCQDCGQVRLHHQGATHQLIVQATAGCSTTVWRTACCLLDTSRSARLN